MVASVGLFHLEMQYTDEIAITLSMGWSLHGKYVFRKGHVGGALPCCQPQQLLSQVFSFLQPLLLFNRGVLPVCEPLTSAEGPFTVTPRLMVSSCVHMSTETCMCKKRNRSRVLQTGLWLGKDMEGLLQGLQLVPLLPEIQRPLLELLLLHPRPQAPDPCLVPGAPLEMGAWGPLLGSSPLAKFWDLQMEGAYLGVSWLYLPGWWLDFWGRFVLFWGSPPAASPSLLHSLPGEESNPHVTHCTLNLQPQPPHPNNCTLNLHP
ncbi:hypothetical protein JZ751_008541 [Albula glossodonta]|uniref:Uncharacterized protein n=1 Tax=Albula glossodonta TaxID=121402 RepID=A0A8T2N936_9TELE|nr:hypothetical protein JZ751_008541 [Albula glossodonta]